MLDATDLQITALDLTIIGRVLRRMANVDTRWSDTASNRRYAKSTVNHRLDTAWDSFWAGNRGAARDAHVADLARMYTMGRMSRIDILPAETVKAFDGI